MTGVITVLVTLIITLTWIFHQQEMCIKDKTQKIGELQREVKKYKCICEGCGED